MRTEKQEKILLIEDDKDFADVLAMRLRKAGYHILLSSDAERGLAKAKETKPGLIILDVALPGMSGMELCKAIRESDDEAFAKTPVLMLTGKTADTDRIVGKVVGADGYVTKPYEIDDLLGEIKKLQRAA